MFLLFRQVKINSLNYLAVKVLFLDSHFVAIRLFEFVESIYQLARIVSNNVQFGDNFVKLPTGHG